jgi:hypothetical protein
MISEEKRMGLISRVYTRKVIMVERNIMSGNVIHEEGIRIP